MSYIGVDIGGTKILSVLYGTDGSEIQRDKRPSKAQESAEIIYGEIRSSIQKVYKKDVESIGIAFAGMVNADSGKVVYAPNIPALHDFPLVERLQQDLGVPTFLENDARLFAYSEHKKCSKEPRCLVGLILGTGVGVGVVWGGHLFCGGGKATELGHIKNPEGYADDLFSGTGLNTLFVQNGLPDVQEIGDNWKQYENQVMPIIETKMKYLVQFLRLITLAYDPAVIVLGGGVGIHLWGHLVQTLEKRLHTDLYPLPYAPKLVVSAHENSGVVGAGLWGQRQLYR